MDLGARFWLGWYMRHAIGIGHSTRVERTHPERHRALVVRVDRGLHVHPVLVVGVRPVGHRRDVPEDRKAKAVS